MRPPTVGYRSRTFQNESFFATFRKAEKHFPDDQGSAPHQRVEHQRPIAATRPLMAPSIVPIIESAIPLSGPAQVPCEAERVVGSAHGTSRHLLRLHKS